MDKTYQKASLPTAEAAEVCRFRAVGKVDNVGSKMSLSLVWGPMGYMIVLVRFQQQPFPFQRVRVSAIRKKSS